MVKISYKYGEICAIYPTFLSYLVRQGNFLTSLSELSDKHHYMLLVALEKDITETEIKIFSVYFTS